MHGRRPQRRSLDGGVLHGRQEVWVPPDSHAGVSRFQAHSATTHHPCPQIWWNVAEIRTSVETYEKLVEIKANKALSSFERK